MVANNASLKKELDNFAKQNQVTGKGALSVALVVTRHAKKHGLPLKADELLTEGGGQVLGLGKSAVQTILSEFNITRVLAEEGGRTSRGSVGFMRSYVEFLNKINKKGLADLEQIEKWWIDRVRGFFANKPFCLRFDPSKSLRAVIRDLLSQALKRQEEQPGATFCGTVLQHLVGAKLDILLGGEVEHHGVSVADQVSGRDADFIVDDVAIHVTSMPGEALIRKCERNLNGGLRPIIITSNTGAPVAEGLAGEAKIADRLDIFEVEQFIAGNLYELGKFAQKGRHDTAETLIEKYNQIVSKCETDPSLRITIGE